MILMVTYFLLLLAGVAIGTVASMIGVGGGVFLVPLLALSGLVATTQKMTCYLYLKN